MRTLTALVIIACMLVIHADPVDAGRTRPRKEVAHYVYSPKNLEKRVAEHRGVHDRVIVEQRLLTTVGEGAPICRLEWRGRRVDFVLGGTGEPVVFRLGVPRGAALAGVDVYVVDRNGKSAEKIDPDDVLVEMTDSLLTVTAPPTEGDRVIDLQYRFDGTGVTVDETFVLQPEWPVLETEYRFSVSKELWQEAVDQGLLWEFTANTTPTSMPPTREDDPDYFTWFWRFNNLDPVSDEHRKARQVTVTGYLPAPALAGFDPDELPDIHSLDDVMSFQEDLVSTYEQSQEGYSSGRGIGGLDTSTDASTVAPASGGSKGR